MKINKILGIMLIVFLVLPIISAVTNESIQAEKLINQARNDINDMSLEGIPTTRVNESYQEAIQVYSSQLFLEKMGKRAEYKTVIEFASEINSIRQISFKANDELKIFKEVFNNAKKEIDLSQMEENYNQTLLSFEEERFEDTLTLINEGYEELSEVQASQTTLKLFYLTTSRTIKNFFINNWLKLLVSIIVLIFLFLIFKTSLSKIKIRIELNYLILKKIALNKLIKNMQDDYFRRKDISGLEYTTKLKKFTEIIRDTDREIMILRERIIKLGKNKSFIKLKENKFNLAPKKTNKEIKKSRARKRLKKIVSKNKKRVVKRKTPNKKVKGFKKNSLSRAKST